MPCCAQKCCTQSDIPDALHSCRRRCSTSMVWDDSVADFSNRTKQLNAPGSQSCPSDPEGAILQRAAQHFCALSPAHAKQSTLGEPAALPFCALSPAQARQSTLGEPGSRSRLRPRVPCTAVQGACRFAPNLHPAGLAQKNKVVLLLFPADGTGHFKSMPVLLQRNTKAQRYTLNLCPFFCSGTRKRNGIL